uniref:RING-type domain-containing protein n=1 Tax=Octopus bimaculoides TaxID=37653 RepID=A0A0L8HQS9_OCTBM
MALSKPDPTPEFVNIEESYLCISCKNVLKNAMMTRCGHRICMECADNLLKNVDSVPCPANEEDCVTLRKFELHEDFSARRYINHQLVYCYNKCYGCPVKMLYKDLSDHSKHLNNCEYWQKKCSNTGCTWTGCLQEKEQHIETCPFQIIKCEDCDSSIRRSDKTHGNRTLNDDDDDDDEKSAKVSENYPAMLGYTCIELNRGLLFNSKKKKKNPGKLCEWVEIPGCLRDPDIIGFSHILTEPADLSHILKLQADLSHGLTSPADLSQSDLLHGLTQPTDLSHGLAPLADLSHSLTPLADLSHGLTSPADLSYILTPLANLYHGLTPLVDLSHGLILLVDLSHCLTPPAGLYHILTPSPDLSHILTLLADLSYSLTPPVDLSHDLTLLLTLDHFQPMLGTLWPFFCY